MIESNQTRKLVNFHILGRLLCLLAAFTIALPVGVWAGLAASTASSNSVTLNWTAPGDDGSTGTASVYDVRYSTEPIAEDNWATSTQATEEPTPQTAGSAESYTVTGLSSSTTYYFGIKTCDEVPNWSLLSNVISTTTSTEQDAPASPDDLLAINPTDSSITLSWTATGDDANTGTASQYDVRYATSPINDGTWDAATPVQGEPLPQLAGSAESLTVYGLNESSTYYFAIKVADEVPNWSSLSNIASASTGNETDSPNAPTDLIALNPTATTVLLTWTATGDDGNIGTASYYDIRYSTQSINDGNWDDATHMTNEPTPQPAGALESFLITGLSHSTEYYFAIKVGDEILNWSGLSNISTAVTIDQTMPAAISDLEIAVN